MEFTFKFLWVYFSFRIIVVGIILSILFRFSIVPPTVRLTGLEPRIPFRPVNLRPRRPVVNPVGENFPEPPPRYCSHGVAPAVPAENTPRLRLRGGSPVNPVSVNNNAGPSTSHGRH